MIPWFWRNHHEYGELRYRISRLGPWEIPSHYSKARMERHSVKTEFISPDFSCNSDSSALRHPSSKKNSNVCLLNQEEKHFNYLRVYAIVHRTGEKVFKASRDSWLKWWVNINTHTVVERIFICYNQDPLAAGWRKESPFSELNVRQQSSVCHVLEPDCLGSNCGWATDLSESLSKTLPVS